MNFLIKFCLSFYFTLRSFSVLLYLEYQGLIELSVVSCDLAMKKNQIFRSQSPGDAGHSAITMTDSNPAENEIQKRRVKTNLSSVFELKKVLPIQSTSTLVKGNCDSQKSADILVSKSSTSARSNSLGNRSGFSGDGELINKKDQDQTSTSVG